MPAARRRLIPALLALALAGAAAAAAGASGPAPGSRPAVVLELFTSQGCSSCPAADRVLSRLGREARHDGVTLVPLAFHVDYWNRLGWVDPFSSSRWSERQRRYAEVFGLRSVYTPQMVLNGRLELVGSREDRLRRQLPAAVMADPVGRVEIVRAELDGAATELVVELAADSYGGDAPSMVANLVVFENGLVTAVESGENARRTLANDHVVRLLRPAIVFAPRRSSARRERLRITLERGWKVANLGLAAFLQDPDTLEIHAAAVRQRLSPPAAAKGHAAGGAG